MTDIALFKKLCLESSNEEHSGWIISNRCRFCFNILTDETFDSGFTYWKAMLFGCHRECKEFGMREEIIDCQVIDADCNDCKYFQRGKMLQKGIASIWEGVCGKFNKPMKAYPNYCSGHKCFEHRRLICI